eukprot:CAMPEP_0195507566 /NCGR_PEP_ID=MMETSP0794_2-20130614/986_1 /TAXON_ID=515487 /ORGANISM="Stephanopyxis turris, Strain CCMP 815" /LENGTH=328 /DNA_ID=CAMNT_0040634295 /DNA_START=108 /DNA_END=1094 /DNA_ORIENTATION=+
MTGSNTKLVMYMVGAFVLFITWDSYGVINTGSRGLNVIDPLRIADQARSHTIQEGGKSIEDIVVQCQPISAEEKQELAKEIKHYESMQKFHDKIKETKGETGLAAHHKSIIKYLKEKVLKKGWSVLDLGAASGGMLRSIIDAYNEMDELKGPHGKFQAVELVTGWVTFAQEFFSDKDRFGDVSFVEGDITDFTLDDPDATFDFVMLNDVMEHLQQKRYGCFFNKLKTVTHEGSIVYMHTPTPEAQLHDKDQFYENVLPHHLLISGMANAGFELVTFEHDMDTECFGHPMKGLPRQIEGGGCYMGGWIKYYHATFVRASNKGLYQLNAS